jgi:hypothetical protein
MGANGHSSRATPGHSQRLSMQLIGPLSDTRQHAATLRRCLLSSGSRVRILPGALSFLGLGTYQRDPSIPTKPVGYRLPGGRRGHGEDSIYWDESRNRYIVAVDLGFSPAGTHIRKKVSGKTKVEVRDKLRELHKETDAGLRAASPVAATMREARPPAKDGSRYRSPWAARPMPSSTSAGEASLST